MKVTAGMTTGKRRLPALAGATLLAATAAAPAVADESGISFWLPGQFGSLAAAPSVPGLSFGTIYLHSSVDAGANKTFTRGGRIQAGINGDVDIAAFGPTYVFEQPFLGAQAAVSALAMVGNTFGSVSATLTGPRGNTISGKASQGLFDAGDVFYQGTLKWHEGVNNFMTYGMGNIPVGAYNKKNLVNLGLGHASIDGGAGYTYFNPANHLEFSGVTGFTYNFENPDTRYQNGVDFHFDWAASYFVTEHLHFGPVGYVYQQVGSDSGPGATLGPFKSRVAAAGGQVGFLFPVTDTVQGYLNLKGYREFAAQNRPEGWNVWATIAFTPAPPKRELTEALLFPK